MLVVMRGEISGTRDGVDWPARGEEIDLPDDEAAGLLASKMVVLPADYVADDGPMTTGADQAVVPDAPTPGPGLTESS